MKYRSELILFILILTASSLVQGKSLKPLDGSRPNIIFVLTDDQGMGDLSCMGNKILRTPNIDNLYKVSTRFTDFQVSPTCSPTRAAIMSGRLPFEVGVSSYPHAARSSCSGSDNFSRGITKSGYQTGLFGSGTWGTGMNIYLKTGAFMRYSRMVPGYWAIWIWRLQGKC